MRRGIASLLMGLSLVLASVGWAGLTLSSTVLDRWSTDLVAQHALDDPMVQSVLVDRIGDGMARIVPEGETMSRQELTAAAENALAHRAGRSAIHAAISEAHRLGLAGEEVDGAFSHFDSNEAVRLALIEERPGLRGEILVNPLVRVALPTNGLGWLSGLRTVINQFTILAIALGIVGFSAAFMVAKDATATMRRAAWWILGAAAFWTLSAIGFGTLAQAVTPSSYVLLASAVESFFAAMRVPTIIMTTFGLGMLAASTVVPALERRQGGFLLARSHQQSDQRATAAAAPGRQSVSTGAGHDHRNTRTARGFSAAWMEGHGYLDDSRVAPFLGQQNELVSGPDRTTVNSGVD